MTDNQRQQIEDWQGAVSAESEIIALDLTNIGVDISGSDIALHDAHLIGCRICEQAHINNGQIVEATTKFLFELAGTGMLSAVLHVISERMEGDGSR